MKPSFIHPSARKSSRRRVKQRVKARKTCRPRQQARPAAAYRQRGADSRCQTESFGAPETWHEPSGNREIRFVVQQPGRGYVHPATVEDIRQRIEQLPRRVTRQLEVVQLSRMTKKRALFPCYGMQWGVSIYLYPIEESFIETYLRPPKPQEQIEARMYGGRWVADGRFWKLVWTPDTIRDFYLNNVLIHEIGHVYDDWNHNALQRERFANWFATEYGYRASRGRSVGR